MTEILMARGESSRIETEMMDEAYRAPENRRRRHPEKDAVDLDEVRMVKPKWAGIPDQALHRLFRRPS